MGNRESNEKKGPSILSYVTDILVFYVLVDSIGFFIGDYWWYGLIGAGIGAVVALIRFLISRKK